MREHGSGFAQAFRTLTIIPVRGRDARRASAQLYFYPFVGLVCGAIGALIVSLCCIFININAVSSICIGSLWTCWMAFVTRAFHLDGLGDTADGFGGGWTRERRLEIMKDSRSGSFSVVAISLCLLLKSAGASYVLYTGNAAVLIWSVTVSRCCVVFMCSFSGYAKESGLSYDLVSGAGLCHALCALLQTAIYGVLLYLLPLNFPVHVTSAAALIAAFCTSLVSWAVLSAVSKSKIGGITGDVLGACAEICETLALLSSVFIL